MEQKKIYDSLVNYIQGERKKGSDKLKPIGSLSRDLGTNRFVLYRLLSRVAVEGLIIPLKNKGYYLKYDKALIHVDRDTSYHNSAKENRMSVRVEILDMDLVEKKALPELSDFFKDAASNRLWSFSILRYFSDIPVSHTVSYLPYSEYRNLNIHFKKTRHLYKALRDFYSVKPKRKRSICEVLIADEYLGRLLSVPSHFPLMKIESYVQTETGQALEYCITSFRSDLVKIQFDL